MVAIRTTAVGAAAMVLVLGPLFAGCATTSGAPVMLSTRTVVVTSGAPAEAPPETVVVTSVSTAVRTVTITATADGRVPFDLSRRVFDEVQVSAGVTSILTGAPPAGYGLTGISDVRCPANQPVEADITFECTLKVDGEEATVTVKVINQDGLYEVNPPS